MGSRAPQTIPALMSNIDQGISLLRHFLVIAEGLKMALEERDRAVKSVKQGFRALDWQEFLEAMHARSDGLGELLDTCKVRKFDLGRLWLETEGYGYTALSLHREQIRDELLRLYGQFFRVRFICEK